MALLLGICASCVLGGWWWVRHENIAFARNATGLPLPEYRPINVCDDSDMTIGFHMKPGAELVRAVEAQSMVLREDYAYAPMDLFATGFCLPVPREPSRLIYAAGCGEFQAWVGLLDPDSDEFWLEVKFPDSGGDVPGCPPGTRRNGQ